MLYNIQSMKEKYCNGCNELKSISEFNKKRSGTQTRCRLCTQKQSQSHYIRNKEKYRNRNISRRENLREAIRQLKAKPCADCGNEYHFCAMDFDHLGESDKEFNISAMIGRGMSLERIYEEAKKCEVVCAVCHRLRTFTRQSNTGE